jgi:hypothetical protein
MADSITRGRISEYVAINALLNNGWEVCEPCVTKAYDLLAKPPNEDKWYRVQVKTAFERTDRNNDIVVFAKRSGGRTYTKEDTDLFVGVLGDKCYLFENTGVTEYWCSQRQIKNGVKWLELAV